MMKEALVGVFMMQTCRGGVDDERGVGGVDDGGRDNAGEESMIKEMLAEAMMLVAIMRRR